MFESEGKAAELQLSANKCYETDMLEQNPVPISGTIAFKPFEIKTLFFPFPDSGI